MLIGTPLPFVRNYVENISFGLGQRRVKSLTLGQKAWLAFALTGIIVTESLCWRKFVRAGLGRYSEALLSWYFRCDNMSWGLLLSISVNAVLTSFNTLEGVLALDDTGKKRSKVTKKIPYVHYFKNKEGTGSIRGQEVVFLVLITPIMTTVVGFAFYQPDPAYTAWAKEWKRLKNKGIPASKRPKKPPINPLYPTKQQLAQLLLEQFEKNHPQVNVKSILADALYGSCEFMNKASKMFGGVQTISQIQSTQKVHYKGRKWRIDEYFKAYPGVHQTIQIRGGEKKRCYCW